LRGRRLLRGLRRPPRARRLLPDRLPRACVRPSRRAIARARPSPGAARRLLPALHPRRLARPAADGGSPREGRARRPDTRPAARSPRDGRPRTRGGPRTTPGGEVLINRMPRYEILSEEAVATLDKGWRRIVSELGIEFLHDDALDAFRKAGMPVEDRNVK